MALDIIFMGTPAFSVPILTALVEAGHRIVAVYSQPPRPGGRRGLDLTRSPVHRAAEDLGLAVFTPEHFRDPADRARFVAHQADVAVVVAYGLLLPQAILDGTRQGCFNGHASLLPRWRGAAPIQRAIMAGDTETGLMVMKMDKGLDTGPVALTRRLPISPEMTAGDLHDALSQLGAEAMVEAMALLERGELPLQPQPAEGVLYAAKIDKAETRIDFSRPAEALHNHIRGLAPAPGAWFEADLQGRPERIKVLAARIAAGRGGRPGEILATAGGGDGPAALVVACGPGPGLVTGALALTRLQRAGGKPLDAEDFLRGTPLVPGMVLPPVGAPA